MNLGNNFFKKMYVLSFYIVLWEGDQMQANVKLSRSFKITACLEDPGTKPDLPQGGRPRIF